MGRDRSTGGPAADFERQTEDPALVAVFPRRQVEAFRPELVAGVVGKGGRMNIKTCKSCGAAIIWIRTRSGRSMPCDAKAVNYRTKPGGNHCLHDGLVVSVVPAEKVPAIVIVIVPEGEGRGNTATRAGSSVCRSTRT